jgi:outer membrane protein assembly factor BamB
VLSKASPGRYTELAHASVLQGTCWTHPVLANGLVYCRSHEGELVCLDMRARKEVAGRSKPLPVLHVKSAQ